MRAACEVGPTRHAGGIAVGVSQAEAGYNSNSNSNLFLLEIRKEGPQRKDQKEDQKEKLSVYTRSPPTLAASEAARSTRTPLPTPNAHADPPHHVCRLKY